MRGGACKAAWRAGALALLLVGAGGCRHKAAVPVVAVPPSAPRPVPVDTTAKEQPQPLLQPIPLLPAPLTSVKLPGKKKVKRPKRAIAQVSPAAPPATAPVLVASAGPAPEASAIGALTPAGNDGPQQRKEAADLIAALGKRLEGLPADVKEKQKDQIVRVMNFRRQAQAALDAGDVDGGLTLATKAKLLLDDLVK